MLDLDYKFYRKVIKEYSGDTLISVYRSPIKVSLWGKNDLPQKEVYTYDTYDELLKYVKKVKNDDENASMYFTDLYIKKHFGKEYVYSHSLAWIEQDDWFAGRLSRRNYQAYRIEETCEECHPTIKQLIEEFPLDMIIDYLNCNSKTIKELIEEIKKVII